MIHHARHLIRQIQAEPARQSDLLLEWKDYEGDGGPWWLLQKYLAGELSDSAVTALLEQEEHPEIQAALDDWARAGGDRRVKIGRQLRKRILDRDGHECAVCGCVEKLHIDHILSSLRGGTNEEDNLQVLCHACNISKSSRLLSNRELAERRLGLGTLPLHDAWPDAPLGQRRAKSPA